MEGSSENSQSNVFNMHHSLEDYYVMTKNKLGKVYIFNQMTFKISILQPKVGHIKDCNDIEEAFQSLKFDVIKYNDLTYKGILKKLSNIAKMDYSEYGCLIVFVLTHGNDDGKIFAQDIAYYPDVYWNTFNESSTLTHKPKLIFIHSPVDEETDCVRVEPARSIPTTYSIPEVPDILLMYSCFDTFISWRSFVTGSSFVQSICKEFKQRAENTDLLTLLTFINREMSDFTGPISQAALGKRKMGLIVSTLNKVLHFGSKNK
ncbi:hypothetical protein RN001_014555 [Aquatica leii]|uniref:Uncharacterized protein n=1 Tax=Aquatica leii TaxID=1421715 RepID=A0AAN7P230_9COLE|nr:hypothetical protein RN001_014555 [Aquatica leii]